LKLNKKISLKIKPKAPFNFDATVFKPDHFPTPVVFEKGQKILWLEKEIRL